MGQRSWNRISRSGLEEFVRCPRCAYLKYGMDVWPPRTPPLSLNLAVDRLLKAEFDRCRVDGGSHPWLDGLDPPLKPFGHEELESWRDARAGVSRHCDEAGITLYGAIDDLWVGPDGAVHVVDYKTTASKSALQMDQPWHDGYRRQMEIYQWLLRGQGLPISDVAYFLFCVVDESQGFDGALRFSSHVVPFHGNDQWVPERLSEMAAVMAADRMPRMGPDCQPCEYRGKVRAALLDRGWLR